MMFGFQGGEQPDTLARKKGYRQDARQRWGFLTHFDLSTIKNEDQLRAMVQGRSGISEAQAKADVHAWMQGQALLTRYHRLLAATEDAAKPRILFLRMRDWEETP